MRALVFAAIVGAMLQSQPLPPGFSEMRAGDLKWTPNPAVPGSQTAVVFGDPTKAGPFAIRARFAAGTRVMPHTHPQPRTYTVLAGEFKLGFGRVFDQAALRSYPAGSVYRLPAGVPHFQVSDAADTIVQIESTGPNATDFLDPKDDPRKKD